MKRKYFVLLLTIICIGITASSCSEDEKESLKKPITGQTTTDGLKIITIGHSFVADAFTYVDALCSNMNLDVSDMAIYQCSRGNGNFKNWVNCWYDEDGGTYSIKNTLSNGLSFPNLACNSTKGTNGAHFRNAIQNYKWDIVIFCNGTDNAKDWDDTTQGGYLSTLESLIRTYQPTAKFYYLFPHQKWLSKAEGAADENPYSITQEKWKTYAEKMKWIEYERGFEMMIPVGTAIENLRMTSVNHEDGTPTYNLTRDGWHLGTGLAQYAASCCTFEKLIAPRYGVTVMSNTLKPNNSNAKTYHFPGGCIRVTNENAQIAKMAAKMAVDSPYELSNVE